MSYADPIDPNERPHYNNRGIITRYAPKLLKDAAKFYSRIEIRNNPNPPQPNLNNDIFPVRANDFIDAGYIFTPYVPLMSTPPVLDPDYMSRRVERVEVEKAEDVDWVKEGF